jgi:hypothetical protein
MTSDNLTPSDFVWAVHLDSRRRPTLPDELLAAAGIPEGADLMARVADRGCIVLETRESVKARLRRRTAHLVGQPSLADELMSERRADAARV